MIWFCSDWHFNHNKEFIWKARGFSSVEEMNEEIVKRHNEVVDKNDIVFVLGDMIMGQAELSIPYLQKMNGEFRYILGNHDTLRKVETIQNNCPNFSLWAAPCIRIKTEYMEEEKRFWLSHYPIDTSNNDDFDGYNIGVCGHIHTTNPLLEIEKGIPCYHVEMDANNCYPTSILKILEAFG